MKLIRVTSNKLTYWALFTTEGNYQCEITTYLIHCVDDLELNESTIRSRAYVLKKWILFIDMNHKKIFETDNKDLKQYRDYLINNHNNNTSGDLQSRKRTINQYLRIIYDFYCWAQLADSTKYILGPSDAYKIHSELTVKTRVVNDFEKYPLLFKRISSKSKHRTTYTPDYEIFLALYRYFISSHSKLVSARNCLILKIAFEGGLRVGSIASLKLEDFDPIRVRESEDYFTVKPSVQKFGMANSFDISVNLALAVVEYIQGPRSELVQLHATKSEYVFLDVVRGSRLLSTSISSEFSKASKQLGLPYRSGIHSWRGLFTENLIDYEIDARQELGFDTSIESIGMVVSKALGHSNPLSQQNYIRSLRSKHKSSKAFKHMQEIATLRQELLNTSKACELLRKEIIELTKGRI